MATVLIELAGVLRSDAGGPIPQGLTLYAALSAYHRLVVVVEDAVEAEHWLKGNGLKEHAQLLQGEMQLAVRRARGPLGLDVAMVVTPSPATAAASMHAGLTALLFAHPLFARPEFRDDVEPERREWSQIEAEIDAQRHAKTRVPTLSDD